MVQSGTQRAFGARLRSFLGATLNSKPKAFIAGLTVTVALQSSTATCLMVTGFIQAGLVGVVPALAVMLGANVGTALIVQMLSLPVAVIAPAFVILGVVMFRRTTGAPKDMGRVFIGLGLVLLALRHLVESVAPYEHAPLMHAVLGQMSDVPALAVLLGCVLAWASHSSVAVVLLVMSLAAQGVIAPVAALALVLGANMGTALNPVFEAPSRGDVKARRLPFGNLVIRLTGVAAAAPFLPEIAALFALFEHDGARLVADSHTLFNVALAVIYLPLLNALGWVLEKAMPLQHPPADPRVPVYLEPLAVHTPVVALGGAAREALRLADALERMLNELRCAFDGGRRKQIAEARRLDDILDSINKAVKNYVTALDPDALTDDDRRRAAHILSFAMHMEQAGDLIDKGLLALASKRVRRGIDFSPDGRTELLSLIDRLIVNVRSAANLFMTCDARAARLLAEEKVAFRQLVAGAGASHFSRLRRGRIDSAETSELHLDILSTLKHVNSHLVEGAAYPVLESTGQLLPSRLLPLADDRPFRGPVASTGASAC